ncbi:MAG TPA: GTP cyclohydrolase I, partial [Acidimicrobiia bacterium]|nr:GTP cyclohydrolase I [Acidimicrobiia bacterium]
MSVDVDRVQKAVLELLEAIGEDPDRDGLLATPERVASMYEELFSGLHDDPARHLEVTFAADHDE